MARAVSAANGRSSGGRLGLLVAHNPAPSDGGDRGQTPSSGSGGSGLQLSAARRRRWRVLVGLARAGRLSLAAAGLLVAAWLVLAGLRVLVTGDGGGTWLLVAALAWIAAALRYSPLVVLRADVSDMEPTLPAWAGDLGVCGLGYVGVRPRHGDLAVVWVHPVVYPAGARYPRMVQRVIGIPGDRVAIRHGQVWRNGATVDEPYCSVPFPADFEMQEAEIPARHYLVLPDRRGDGAPRTDAPPRGAGWLLGAEQVLGRAWFHRAEGGGVRLIPRRWPWLEAVGMLLGPVVCGLDWCFAQVRRRPPRPAPRDEEPTRVHTLCDACRGRWLLVPAQKQRQGGLPPGFRWVTPTGLQAPRNRMRNS
jgi:signal peptidase I